MKTPHATSAHLEAMGFLVYKARSHFRLQTDAQHNKPNCAAVEQ